MVKSRDGQSSPGKPARHIRVLVVEDSPVTMRAVGNLLAMHPLLEVVGTAWNGLEGLALAERHSPDLVLMDLEMPVMGGLQLAETLRRKFPTMRLVVLSTHDGNMWHKLSRTRGADAFVTKHRFPGELADLLARFFPDTAAGSVAARDSKNTK